MVWQSLSISIHTSAREVTPAPAAVSVTLSFQSTLPQGKWRSIDAVIQVPSDFNPHFRKGSDRPAWYIWLWHPDFNPHFRKGSDFTADCNSAGITNFNPHFRKGSDFPPSVSPHRSTIFQSTLPQGKWRHYHAVIYAVFVISIHTSAREVTKCRWQTFFSFAYFNPHFRKGSDWSIRDTIISELDFNPHFRKGSDRSPQGASAWL